MSNMQIIILLESKHNKIDKNEKVAIINSWIRKLFIKEIINKVNFNAKDKGRWKNCAIT